jgi:hypothetical protein
MKKRPYPVVDLTGGININRDPLLIQDKESPNATCVRIEDGIIKKDMGWRAIGLPLLGTPMMIDTFYKSDGIYRVLCFTTTSAYRWDSTLLEWIDITCGVELSDCESAWTASANVTCTNDTALYKKGSKSVKNALAAGFTTGLASYIDFASKDLTSYTQIHLWVYSSVNLTAGQAQFLMDDTSACASPIETIDLPAIVANTWTRVSLAIAVPASCGAIASIGLKMTADVGAANIYLDDIRAVLESTGDISDSYSGTTFMDTYIVTNYKDVMKKYDAAPDYLEVLGGSPPKAKSITTFMNRLVCCFTNETGTDHPFKVRWSDPGTIETWTASNYLEASDNSEWCVALKNIGGKCALFKEMSIWDLQYIGGTVVFQLTMRINQVGTMAPSAIANLRETLLFFGYDGIYNYDQTQVQCISDNIYPSLFRTGTKTINLAAVRSFCGMYTEELHEYWISLCEYGNTYPSLLYKFSMETKSFVKRVNLPITCMGYMERTAAMATWATATELWSTYPSAWAQQNLPPNAATILVGYNTGQIYEDDRSTTTNDAFVFETKDFMFGHACRVVECRVACRYGGYTIYYSTDGGVTWITGTSFAYATDWVEHVYYINITTQRIRFKIYTTEGAIEIRWIEPWVLERTRSKLLTTA